MQSLACMFLSAIVSLVVRSLASSLVHSGVPRPFASSLFFTRAFRDAGACTTASRSQVLCAQDTLASALMANVRNGTCAMLIRRR